MNAACRRCGHELDAGRAGDRCPRCGEAVPALPPPDDKADEDSSETSEWLAGAPSSLWGAGQSPDQGGIGSLLTPPEGPGEIGRLGPYRILKVLGVGGMGVVFQGHDPSLDRIVAIKGMLPAVAAKEANRLRFMREARATATIRHENIIAVHSVGEDRGLPYLVMEFLEGETLQDRLLREAQLPIDEVVRIGLEAAEGLDAAHRAGLIHRDIKPANIWLEREGGRVKILDFGLARATAEDSHLTLSGVIMGTPAFMAPEQARGQPVDYRADLFSLGSVLYRMCTGQLPFEGPDTFSTLTALAVENPRPPHLARPDVPGRLANLITALLAKRPDDRPATARAVCDTLPVHPARPGGRPHFRLRPDASSTSWASRPTTRKRRRRKCRSRSASPASRWRRCTDWSATRSAATASAKSSAGATTASRSAPAIGPAATRSP